MLRKQFARQLQLLDMDAQPAGGYGRTCAPAGDD